MVSQYTVERSEKDIAIQDISKFLDSDSAELLSKSISSLSPNTPISFCFSQNYTFNSSSQESRHTNPEFRNISPSPSLRRRPPPPPPNQLKKDTLEIPSSYPPFNPTNAHQTDTHIQRSLSDPNVPSQASNTCSHQQCEDRSNSPEDCPTSPFCSPFDSPDMRPSMSDVAPVVEPVIWKSEGDSGVHDLFGEMDSDLSTSFAEDALPSDIPHRTYFPTPRSPRKTPLRPHSTSPRKSNTNSKSPKLDTGVLLAHQLPLTLPKSVIQLNREGPAVFLSKRERTRGSSDDDKKGEPAEDDQTPKAAPLAQDATDKQGCLQSNKSQIQNLKDANLRLVAEVERLKVEKGNEIAEKEYWKAKWLASDRLLNHHGLISPLPGRLE